ncbi:tetratricopeptide repeat protein [Hymenobacter sp. HD11105]
MKNVLVLAALLLAFGATPTLAQRKNKKDKNAATASVSKANRLLPLFGGIGPAQAEQVVGPNFLADIDRNFASRAEASKFFSTKGFEYLTENQPDTAIYRFNLAWLLDQKNADAYRGLGVVKSSNPTPDESIQLLSQAAALAPTDALILSDLGALYLIRYEQSKKKKDLATGMEHMQKAITADPNNAVAWQQMARGYYFQEDYTKAWEAVHKGQGLNMASTDFSFIGELLAKQPDPTGKFK